MQLYTVLVSFSTMDRSIVLGRFSLTFLPGDRAESPRPGIRALCLLLGVLKVCGLRPACCGVGSLAAGPAAPQDPD